MPRIDARLLPVVTDIERGLRELGIPFGIVGALVPELLLDARPARMTNDADVVVIAPHAVLTPVDGGPELPLAPLPLYALLKLVAFSDRKAGKDLGSLLHCLEHYLEDDDRRYGVDFEGQGVPWEYTCAYLLGVDGRTYLDAETAAAVGPVLQGFTDADADVVGRAAAERGRLSVDEEHRVHVFELFRWYRLGTGLLPQRPWQSDPVDTNG